MRSQDGSRAGPRNRALGQAHTIAALFGAESTRGPFRRPGPGAGQRWSPSVPKRRARPTEDTEAARKCSRSVGCGAPGLRSGPCTGASPFVGRRAMEIASGVVLCWLFFLFSSLPKQPSCVFWSPVNHSSSSGKRGEEYMIQARKNAGRLGELAEEARNEPRAGAAPSCPGGPSPCRAVPGEQRGWDSRHLGRDSVGTARGRATEAAARRDPARRSGEPSAHSLPAGQVASKISKTSRFAQPKGSEQRKRSVMGLAGTGGPRGSQSTSVPMGGTGVSPDRCQGACRELSGGRRSDGKDFCSVWEFTRLPAMGRGWARCLWSSLGAPKSPCHSHAISPAAIKLAGARAGSYPAGCAAGRLLRAPKMLTAIVAAAPGTQIVLQHHQGGSPRGFGAPQEHVPGMPVSLSPHKAPSCCYCEQFVSVGRCEHFISPFVLFLSNFRLA